MMRILAMTILLLGVAIPTAMSGEAEAALGYRGTDNSGIFPAEGLLTEWPEGGPELLWKYDVGIGYAGVTVHDGKVYVAGGELSRLFVFSPEGQLLKNIVAGGAGWKRFSGTRSTPLVKGDIVLTTTPDANHYGIDVEKGEIRWKLNPWTDIGAGKGSMGWGYPSSPMLHGDKVIINPCSRFDETPPVIAVDIATGKTLWEADAGTGKKYSSADVSGSLIDHKGRKLVVFPTWRYLLCLDADTGERLWEIADEGSKNITPIYSDGYLLWDPKGKAQMLKLADDGASYQVLWERSPVGGRYSHGVILDGRLYCFGDPDDTPVVPAEVAEGEDCEPPKGKKKKGGNALLCLDAATGRLIHSRPAATPGHICAADGRLYVVELLGAKEKGKVGRPRLTLVEPTAEGFVEKGSFVPELADAEVALRDVDWQASVCPVISDGRLYFRYGPLLVYELRAEKTAEIRAAKARIAKLVATVEGDDAQARARALDEIAALGWRARSATAALVALLKDEDEATRKRAGELLAGIGPDCIAKLVPALADEAVWQEGIAAKALVAVSPDCGTVGEALLMAAESRRALRDTIKPLLPRCEDGTAALLGRKLRDCEKVFRWWVVDALKDFGPRAAPAASDLAWITTSQDQWFRANGAEALGLIGPAAKAAGPELVALCSHGYADARRKAAIALGKIGVKNDVVVAALEKLKQDKDGAVVEAATKALEDLE